MQSVEQIWDDLKVPEFLDTNGKEVLSYKEACDQLFTERQILIVKLFGIGLTYKEMAKILGCTVNTVKSHVQTIRNKLNLRGNNSLEKWCWLNHDAIYKK